jgi:nucleotide-binding universal stress UspA family protein
MISHAARTTQLPTETQADLLPYSRILVPLDGSALAEEALPPAIAFAQRAGANGKVILLRASVIECIISSRGGPVAVPIGVHQEIDAYLAGLEAAIRAQGVAVEAVRAAGDAAMSIADVVHDQHADLIILVTRALEGMGHLVHGSVAERMLQGSPVPILLLKHGEQPLNLFSPARHPHLLVPLDGSALAETVLPQAIALAGQLGASLTLLRVLSTPALVLADSGSVDAPVGAIRASIPTERRAAMQYLDHIQQRLQSRGIPTAIAITEGDAGEAIAAQARALEAAGNATLIVMATHGHGGVGRWPYGNVASAVLHLADVPLLAIRPR